METSQIVCFFVTWAVVTFGLVALIRSKRVKLNALWGGAFFLLATVLGLLAVYSQFEVALRCAEASCWSDRARADSLVQFLLITWGALGGGLIAKGIDAA